MERLRFTDIKDYRQQAFPAEGFRVETEPPKFRIIPLTDFARVMVTGNPAFLVIQERRREMKIPKKYDPVELNGKAVHATYSLMLFLDRYPLPKKISPEEHIQKTVEDNLLHHFLSFKNIQAETTSKFLIEAGENVWFRGGEGEEERKAKIAFLFDAVRTTLLNQKDHEEYIFGENDFPPYDLMWLKTWESFRHNGLLSLRNLDRFFGHHLSRQKIWGTGIFSELTLIQRFYHDRSGILRIQVNGRPDLMVAISAIDPQTGRLQFSHWQVYDFKNKKRHYKDIIERKVDRTQLWLNMRALARASYQTLQKRKEGKAVSLEGSIPGEIPVEGYLIYARENFEDTMIEKVEFSPEEEKTNEDSLYYWLRWYRKKKGVLI